MPTRFFLGWIFALLAQVAMAQPIMRVAAPAGAEFYFPRISGIYTAMGYKAIITALPPERAYMEANAGRDYDAHAGAVTERLDNYPNLVKTHESFGTIDIQAWVKKGSSITIQSVQDLHRYRVGHVRGAKSTENMLASLKIHAQTASSIDQLANMLDAGRFDIALLPHVMLEPPIKDVGTLVAPKLASLPAFHWFHKKHADLVGKWDSTLKAMKADGRFAALVSSTTLKPTAP